MSAQFELNVKYLTSSNHNNYKLQKYHCKFSQAMVPTENGTYTAVI